MTETRDPLLTPLTIKGLVLCNRVFSASHSISYDDGGMPAEHYQRYHEEKARGGIALTMFGGSATVAVDSPSVFGQLNVSHDRVIPYFERFAERIHAQGAALMCQITHMGRRTSPQVGDWLPSIGPSRVHEDLYGGIPKAMDEHDIARCIKAYGAAARRCFLGGLDGCEVLATGHLVDQFWTPRVNKRTDRWGGCLDNRMRFGRMVLEEMRRQTADDFILSLRMTMDEDCAEGLTRDDCLTIAQTYEREGLVDILNLVHGSVDTLSSLALNMPGMSVGLAPYLRLAGEFKRELRLPVFHSTRLNDMATARHAIREGLIDMVGITRGHIADPHIVNKIVQGDEHRIRHCVGATYCSTYRQCIQNAATGREAAMPHDIVRKTGACVRAVVVGGGPAGLEAARVLASRGHSVVLLEATGRLGGQVALAARATWRRDLIGITDWLAAEVKLLGVEVRFNTLADEAMVLAESPGIVIIATGGVPDTDDVAGDAKIWSTWDVLAAPETFTSKVLLYDSIGAAPAAACASVLIAKKTTLEFVTHHRSLIQNVMKLDQPKYLSLLYRSGVTMTTDHRLISATRCNERTHVKLRNELTGSCVERIVDTVIVENGSLPNDAIWLGLRPQSVNYGVTDVDALAANMPQNLSTNPSGSFRLYRVGDAISSRDIHTAIYDSLRLCKDL